MFLFVFAYDNLYFTVNMVAAKTIIGVNFCKAPRLEPPHFLKSKALHAFEPPHFLSDAVYFFAYYEDVLITLMKLLLKSCSIK